MADVGNGSVAPGSREKAAKIPDAGAAGTFINGNKQAFTLRV
jgi:hypothetical protein